MKDYIDMAVYLSMIMVTGYLMLYMILNIIT